MSATTASAAATTATTTAHAASTTATAHAASAAATAYAAATAAARGSANGTARAARTARRGAAGGEGAARSTTAGAVSELAARRARTAGVGTSHRGARAALIEVARSGTLGARARAGTSAGRGLRGCGTSAERTVALLGVRIVHLRIRVVHLGSVSIAHATAATIVAIAKRAVASIVVGAIDTIVVVGTALHIVIIRTLAIAKRAVATIVVGAVVGTIVKTPLSTSEISTAEAVLHSHVMIASTTSAKITAMIVGTSAVHTPAVSTTIDAIENWASEEEIVAMRIAGIDAEVPVTCIPVEGAIEVAGCDKRAILPVEQNVAQVEIALLPVDSIEVVWSVDAHQIVEVHLECGFVLLFCKIQFIRHLVCQEECLLTSLFVTHGVGRNGECKQCHKGDDHFFHILMVLKCLYSCSRCKDMNKYSPPKRIFPKQRGENPYKTILRRRM